MDLGLTGKSAIVTGAAQGIGRAIAEMLLDEGAHLALVDIDGARIHFDGGWALVRASNTEPVLVLRFEADSEERLASIRNEVESVVQRFRNA